MSDKAEAWRTAFDERHQFDVYPDDFMTGMRNEFCAGWHAALKSQAASQPTLKVWYGPMPESNGKTNWTAILHRGDVWRGITIDRSEYPDRVRYEADRMRWMIGELADEPWILDYDADKHSGYTNSASQPKSLTVQQICDIWLEQTGTPEVDAPYPIIEFALAILEAAK